jgi:hypothetical protein
MSVLADVPVERITARAAQVDMGRSMLAVIGGLLYLVGYLPSRAVRALAWMCSAIAVGWVEGRTPVKPGGGTDG